MREDIVNSIPEAPVFDRREFLVTSIFAAGTFASAVLPIQGQTKITTDANGLVVGEANPWGAAGLEWKTSSPPPTFNFEETPKVTWEAYNYEEIPAPEEARVAG